VTTDLERYADWLEWLRDRAREDDDALAVWVGGSAVTGGWDEHSDLDVDVLCTPGTVDQVYVRMLARAKEDFDLPDVWELPLATWPDGRQCFLNLQARPGLLAQPTRTIDLHLSDLSDAHRLIDVRRHGRPMVLHDPDALIELRADDADLQATQIAEAVDQVRQRRVTGEWLVNRAIRRGHLAEAVDLYLRFALAPVVRLLRVEHCPWRHDYGLRYLREDLPADVAERVESLVPVNGDLADLSTRCFAWLDELLLAEPG
jgi:predicted nucleotidyltransferase